MVYYQNALWGSGQVNMLFNEDGDTAALMTQCANNWNVLQLVSYSSITSDPWVVFQESGTSNYDHSDCNSANYLFNENSVPFSTSNTAVSIVTGSGGCGGTISYFSKLLF